MFETMALKKHERGRYNYNVFIFLSVMSMTNRSEKDTIKAPIFLLFDKVVEIALLANGI